MCRSHKALSWVSRRSRTCWTSRSRTRWIRRRRRRTMIKATTTTRWTSTTAARRNTSRCRRQRQQRLRCLKSRFVPPFANPSRLINLRILLGCRFEGNSRWDSQVEGGDREAREPHSSPGGSGEGARRREQHQGREGECSGIDNEAIEPISTWRSISNEFSRFLRLRLSHSSSTSLSLSLSLSINVSAKILPRNTLSHGSTMVPTATTRNKIFLCRHFSAFSVRLSEEIFVINQICFLLNGEGTWRRLDGRWALDGFEIL